MIFELTLTILAGIMAGTISGLTPGIHTNLISSILVAIVASTSLSPFFAVCFILSVALTHAITDIIPSIYLNAPSEDNVMVLQPAQKLLMHGLGHEAVKLTLYGSFFCVIAGVISFPILLYLIPLLYKLLKPIMIFVLIGIVLFLIYREENKIWAGISFILSGLLGLVVLNSGVSEPLLPLFSGLFGLSSILLSDNKIISQKTTDLIRPRIKEVVLASLGGILSTLVITLFPGLGPSQAATLGKKLMPQKNKYDYLMFLGGIRTVDVLISFITWYTIQKTRNGSIVAIEQIITKLTFDKMLFFIALLFFVASTVSLLTILLSKVFIRIINKIDYLKLRIVVLCIIALFTAIFSGFHGIVVLIFATLIGLLPILSKTARSNSMGVLLVPTIIVYLTR